MKTEDSPLQSISFEAKVNRKMAARLSQLLRDDTNIIESNQLMNNNNDDGDDIFVYTGGEQEVPRDVKRVRIAENINTIPAWTFAHCRQLIEVEGHDKLKKIEQRAFHECPSLRRATKMQGVVEVEDYAFGRCSALSELDFDKLEIIGLGAFTDCKSLSATNMPSVRRIGAYAFNGCDALTDVVLGEKLERIYALAFYGCSALRSISIPLKHGGLIFVENSFNYCNNLSRVDILDGIHESITSLHLESWRKDMEQEIDSINQNLPNIRVLFGWGKGQEIQEWIRRVLFRMEHYKSEHKVLVKEAMTLLELALWKANLHDDVGDDAAAQEGIRVTRGRRNRKRKDKYITSGASIVIKNVLPFLGHITYPVESQWYGSI